MKRSFDVLASLAGLVVVSPLLFLISLAVKVSSPGPVLFRQERVGQHGKPFNIWKFRTMVNDAPGHGQIITIGGDIRVTYIGKFLRRYKLDELPQLVNVLRGEMSLVGPRPEVAHYVEMFWDQFESILDSKPGITHRASILFRNEEQLLFNSRDPERYYVEMIMPRKLELYTSGMKKEGILEDVRTILDTIYQVARLSPSGELPALPTPPVKRPTTRPLKPAAAEKQLMQMKA